MYREQLTVTYEKEKADAGAEGITSDVTKTYESYQSWLMFGIIIFSLKAFCFACMVVCGRQSLKLAIDVIDASADFLYGTKRIVAVPVIYFFVTLIVVFVWLGMLLCVVSMAGFEPSTSIPQLKRIKGWGKEYGGSDFDYWALWYMVGGLIWLVSFIQYKTRFIVQVSASSYYFNSTRD